MAARHLPLTLLGLSILCSVASFAVLLIHPEGTGSLRTALNVVAILLVITTTAVLARGGRMEPRS